MTMYKITLFDENSSSVSDGVVSVFVDSLEEFEKEWIPLQRDEKRIRRYFQSKNGKIVTDYWTDDPKFNIVQKADMEMIREFTYTQTDKSMQLHNLYRYPSDYHFDELEISVRYVKADDAYLKLAKYKITGGCVLRDIFGWVGSGSEKYEKMGVEKCRESGLFDEWNQIKEDGCTVARYVGKYDLIRVYGNPFLTKKVHTSEGHILDTSDDMEDFKDTSYELYIWRLVKSFDTEEEMNEDMKDYRLSEELNEYYISELEILMHDLPGEAG